MKIIATLLLWVSVLLATSNLLLPAQTVGSPAVQIKPETPELQDKIELPNPNQHDRLFQALHSAQILAEIGSANEAVRIVAAIASFDHPSPPVEEARRRLQQWGLSVEATKTKSPDEIARILKRNLSAKQTLPQDFLHFDILLSLEASDKATQFLHERLLEERAGPEGPLTWRQHLQNQGFSIPEDLSSSKTLQPIVDSLSEDKKLWRSIQRLWFIDHHTCHLALRLWQVGHKSDRHQHPAFHEHHQPWQEVLQETLHRAIDLQTEHPNHANTLLTLLFHYGDNPDVSRRAKDLLDRFQDKLNNEPAASSFHPSENQNNTFTVNKQQQVGDNIFSSSEILAYRLELSPNSAERLRENPREYVPATFYYQQEIYPNVGVRLKGGAGSFRPFDGQDKVGLTIKFNRFNKQQRFHGLRRIVLNNAVQDATYLNEFLGYGLFRDAGLPAPRVTHATLTINDDYYGLYVQPEAITKDFLKAWFRDASGNLYEGPGDILDWEHLDLDTNQEQNDRSDLRRLVERIEHADDQNPWPQLESLLRPQSIARFIAIEQLLGHWDGFAATNNYRIYHSPETDRFTLIPHGADQLFESLNHSVFHDQASILGRAILQTDFGRQIYREQMLQIVNRHWNETQLKRLIKTLYLKLLPTLQKRAGRGHNDLADFQQRVLQTIQFIELRRSVVIAQLENQRPNHWRRPKQSTGLPSFLRSE